MTVLRSSVFGGNKAAWCCVVWAIAPTAADRAIETGCPWHYQHNPSVISAQLPAQGKKTVGTILDIHIFTVFFMIAYINSPLSFLYYLQLNKYSSESCHLAKKLYYWNRGNQKL
ncbi:MAG: hypothetical protein LH628_01660 [Microcoleus sp. CAN_BIN18]|nr:hypothetical protein [Microcoleus sp. CAN_BIN18]